MVGFFTAPKIAWGPGAIEQLSGLGARRAAVVVDPNVAELHGHRRVVEELEKSDTSVDVIDDLSELDRRPTVTTLARRLRAAAPDWVVAVGGGRTIDATKAARLAVERPEIPLEATVPVLELPETLAPRLVACPTTSGSGAEANGTIDLTDAEGAPFELAHRAAAPDWALVDPSLARSLPPERLVDGALETAAQALEAYLSAWANPLANALSSDAVATVLTRLPHALRWSDDPDARDALHLAATAAGLASGNAQRGVAHALARSLTGPTGLPYGRLVGIVLPHAVEFDRPSARDRLEELGATLARSEERGPVPLEVRLRRLYEVARVPSTLVAAGVDRATVLERRSVIVAHASRSPALLANPRVPNGTELERLLDRVLG